MIFIPLRNHNPGGAHGHHGALGVNVELDDDGSVRLSIDGEGPDRKDGDSDRSLLVDEARALAAALWHFAGEAERR